MPHPWFSSETLKESHLGECPWRALVTLLFRGPERESAQPFLIEKGEMTCPSPKRVGRSMKSTEETPYHSPAVTFVLSRNNEDGVVLPHSTNARFSSFGIAVLGARRDLSIS